MNYSSATEYNILLFGETGAGKSTTINALANYLRYDSIEAATSGDFVQTIPSKVRLLDPKTYEPLVIKGDLDEDLNECHNDLGASVTQCPKSYSFEFDDKRFNIIDTPGLGDTGGIEVDKRNIRKILDHFKRIKTLNAICFLIKTNTTRKTAAFRYCLNELLSFLDRDTARTNLVFCFTFCRNSLYGPGDGYETLKQFLFENENKGVEVQLNSGVNCYFIDNEAYHYLVARKHGYPFTKDKMKSYKESWDNSSTAVKQMLNYIVKLPPISLLKTANLLNARKWIPYLKEPIETLQNALNIQIDPLITLENQNLNNFQEEHQELFLICKFACKLSYFFIEHSNTTCETLIEPYLQNLNPKNKQNQNSDLIEIVDEFIEKTRERINTNLIAKSEWKDILKLRQQLAQTKRFGVYFRQKMQIPIKRPKGPAPLPPMQNIVLLQKYSDIPSSSSKLKCKSTLDNSTKPEIESSLPKQHENYQKASSSNTSDIKHYFSNNQIVEETTLDDNDSSKKKSFLKRSKLVVDIALSKLRSKNSKQYNF